MMPSTELNDLQSFPVPDNDALQHNQAVQEALYEYIARQNGVIRFDQYMSFVLYEPCLGYYSSGNQKFGEGGDFITAPELSPLFSKCLANQCQQILSEFGSASILELGAGSGIMACEIMKQLERVNTLPEEYMIMEISADLRERQQALISDHIPHLVNRVHWLNTLPEQEFSGIMLGNEVIDAIPVRRFVVKDNQKKELGVGIDKNEQLVWKSMDIDEVLENEIDRIKISLSEPFTDMYVSEINLQLQPWLVSLSGCLKKGVMLFVDYGYPVKDYYHPQRQNGTLLCHYRQRAHDNPFLFPGIQDITASVNFTALAEAADQAGLDVKGYTTQAYFLMANGLDNEMQAFDQNNTKLWLEISRQARILTLPGEMGERFKVMALTKNFNNVLQGFSIRDQRALL